jgi:hypothetical protein
MNALKDFVNLGGRVTRQVGNSIFGIDGGMGRYEVLVFDANNGDLVKSKPIKNSDMYKINSVDDIHDFVYGTPTKPDFVSTIAVK